MQKRKITVVSTKNQKKSVIMSAATTLAELKADLRQNGIDYEGMTFYEGTSKTELKDNNSVLPHDVPYKGTTTNELVFMLTNTNKKIRSGADMSRADAYAAIKANGLQEECVKRFSKNFTMCKTADLITLVKEKSAKEEIKEHASTAEYVDTKARVAISRLTEILYDNDYIEYNQKDEILDILGDKVEVASPYSNDEIDRMFDFAR